MHPIARLSPLFVLAALPLALSGPAPAAARYDGSWSVLVVTEAGTCDRAYRYPVRVENGAVRYVGEAGIDLSGQVAPNGAVKVTIRRGEQSATGSGRLSADGGSGTWSGSSPTSQCSGSWQAERRAGS
ncbi:MAG: hypothetical protein AB7K35_11350 [Pseudorhodoplanes sp.]